MTNKELKRLSRAELLELLLIQTKETEHLRMKLELAEQKLADRNIQIQNSGDLAQAVLAVNGVVESAAAAAAQYLENIARMEEETNLRCRQLLEQAQAEAERIRAGALAQAEISAPPQDTDPAPAEKPPANLEELLTQVHDLIDQ